MGARVLALAITFTILSISSQHGLAQQKWGAEGGFHSAYHYEGAKRGTPAVVMPPGGPGYASTVGYSQQTAANVAGPNAAAGVPGWATTVDFSQHMMPGATMGHMPPPQFASPAHGVMPFAEGPYAYGPDDQLPMTGDCDGNCGGCDACRSPRFWVSAGYLLGWRRGRHLPPMVTTSPLGTDRDEAGVLGQPNTTILFGNRSYEDGPQSGGEVMLSYKLREDGRTSIGVRGFALANEKIGFTAQATGDEMILAQPFHNGFLDEADAYLLSFPNLSDGSIDIQGTNELFGGEAFMVRNIPLGRGRLSYLLTEVFDRVDLITGYHFTRMNDGLTVASTLIDREPGGLIPEGTEFDRTDWFDTRNEFHGWSFGMLGRTNRGPFTFTALGKASLGDMKQMAKIDGQTITRAPLGGPVVVTDTGFLAQATNIGEFERHRFAVVPEARLNLAYQLNKKTSVNVGYWFMYWNRVLTAGDQIDTTLDLNAAIVQPGGSTRPAFTFNETHFYAHGLNFSVDCRF